MLSDKVVEIIGLTIESYGRAASEGVLMLWMEDLLEFPENEILDALKRYREDRRNQKAPTVGQIIALIRRVEEDGRPSPDEAWAIIKPLVHNENLSAIVIPEMKDGYSAAWALGRDEIGARRAFIDTYNRSVEANRAAGIPCEWGIWPGLDKGMLADVISQGLQDGRLKREDVKHLLPAPTSGHLQLTDLVRENIDRSSNGLPQLQDLSALEDVKTRSMKRLEAIKNGLENKNLHDVFFLSQQTREELASIEPRPGKSDYAEVFNAKREEQLEKVNNLKEKIK